MMDNNEINTKEKDATITLHMDEDLKNTLKRIAKNDGQSLNDFMMTLVLSGLEYDQNIRESRRKLASKLITKSDKYE